MNSLLNLLKNEVGLNEEEIKLVPNLQSLIVEKNQIILEQGNPSPYFFYISSGCFRLYFHNKDGEEHITRFAIENEWMGDYGSFYNKGLSNVSIQALEGSEILLLHFETAISLFRLSPKFMEYSRKIRIKDSDYYESRIRDYLGKSAEDRYESFQKNNPELVKRISLKHLASFIGIAPESLSRLRKKNT